MAWPQHSFTVGVIHRARGGRSMRSRSVLSSVLAAAAVPVSGVACSGDSDKSGGDAAATTTLKMATMEGRGAPYADSVIEFARQVEQLSDGSLRLEIIW